MQSTLIQALAAVIVVATPLLASAAPQEVKHLPRVVITGKSQATMQMTTQQVVQLPRVVIIGRSSTAMALNSVTKPVARHS